MERTDRTIPRKHLRIKVNRTAMTAHVAADAVTLQQQGRETILSDVLGSYTGTPKDGEQPVQDADDL